MIFKKSGYIVLNEPGKQNVDLKKLEHFTKQLDRFDQMDLTGRHMLTDGYAHDVVMTCIQIKPTKLRMVSDRIMKSGN